MPLSQSFEVDDHGLRCENAQDPQKCWLDAHDLPCEVLGYLFAMMALLRETAMHPDCSRTTESRQRR